MILCVWGDNFEEKLNFIWFLIFKGFILNIRKRDLNLINIYKSFFYVF